MAYISDLDRAIDGLNNAQLSALSVRTSLMSFPTLIRDLDGQKIENPDSDLTYEDNLVFVTFAAFCTSITTVLVFDAFLKQKANALQTAQTEIAHRFAEGAFWNDPDAQDLTKFSDHSDNLFSKLTTMQEFAFWDIKSPAPSMAQTSAALAQRVGTGHNLRKDAADVYNSAFQITNTSDLRNAFVADATRFQQGADIHEILSAPLFDDLPETTQLLKEWTSLRDTLRQSTVADWSSWLGWLQRRIDGSPIELDEQLRWGAILLDEFPSASRFNRLYT